MHQPHDSRPVFNNFQDLREKVSFPPQVQPAPVEFHGEVARYYKTKRNGRIVQVWLVEVKKGKAIVKDNKDDKHSRSLSLAEFVKFYA